MPHNGRRCRAARCFILLPLLVAAVLGGLAGSAATGLDARSAGLGAGDLPARHHHGDPGQRRLDDRALRHRAADPDLARARSRRSCATRSSRPRTRTSTATAAWIWSARSRPSSPIRAAPALRPGRLHAHAAARARDLPLAAQDDLAEDQRGPRLLRDRATLLEGTDPDDVRQRDLARARQLRIRGGFPLLLRQEPEEPEPRRGRAARRDRPAARRTSPPSATPRSPGAAARRPCAGWAPRATSRRRSGRPPTRSRSRRPRRSRRRSSLPISARRSGSISRRRTGRRTSTAAACAWTRRSTRSSRPSPRRRSAGASGGSPGVTGSTSPATCAPRGIRIPASYVDPSWETARLAEGDTAHGVVMEVSPASARRSRSARRLFPLRASGFAWTGADAGQKILKAGDLVTVTLREGEGRRRAAPRGGAEGAGLRPDPRELERRDPGDGGRLRLDASRSSTGPIQALRQAGSTFKPFVYLAALEPGYTPSDTIFDGPIAIVIDPRQPPYRPGNYDKKFRGIVTLRGALEHSINVPTVRLAQLVGLVTRHRVGAAPRASARSSRPTPPSRWALSR